MAPAGLRAPHDVGASGGYAANLFRFAAKALFGVAVPGALSVVAADVAVAPSVSVVWCLLNGCQQSSM